MGRTYYGKPGKTKAPAPTTPVVTAILHKSKPAAPAPAPDSASVTRSKSIVPGSPAPVLVATYVPAPAPAGSFAPIQRNRILKGRYFLG